MTAQAPIAVSCGEPAGIGPEIAAKAAQAPAPPFFVIGNPDHFAGHGAEIISIDTPAQAAHMPEGALAVLQLDIPGPACPGQPNPAQAKGVIASIETATKLAMTGAAAAITTLPIHKKALMDGAGFAHPGHTEFLAYLGNQADVVMMLACDALKVVPATIHIPLAAVPQALSAAKLRRVIEVTVAGLQRDFAIAAPRVAVAGLNPHAGEGGAMGEEELTRIGPLIAELQAEGLDITGPCSADTMFHDAARAHYDVAIAMYHDQALIPIKTLDFSGGVNVTLGLPFIRTSPDHGTAFDIAGTGQADPTSFLAALRMAAKMAKARAHGAH